MKSAEFDQRIQAALLWDAPTLLQYDDEGSKAFGEALRGRSVSEPESISADMDALVLAAKAVYARFADRGSDARLAARLLTEFTRFEDRILGWMLLCWMGDVSDTDWEIASSLVANVSDDQLRSRLLTKLFVFAYDDGEADLAEGFLDAATERAEGWLKMQLRVIGTNVYGRAIDFPKDRPIADDLVELSWILNAALEATDTAMKDLAMGSISSGSTRFQRYGTSSASRLWVAESQATWAGAFWHRDTLRSHLVSVLVLEGLTDESSARDTVGLWVSTRRSNVSGLVDFAEPLFGPSTADLIVTDDIAIERRTRRGYPSYVAVVDSLWDLYSEEVAAAVLNSLQPSTSDHPTDARVRRLWAKLALRIPDVWLSEFRNLDEPVRRKVASTFAPGASATLSDELLEVILPALMPNVESEVIPFVAAAGARLGYSNLISTETWHDAPMSDLIDLAIHNSELVPLAVVEDALATLIERVELDLRKGRLGSHTFGSSDPRVQLGRVVGETGRSVINARKVLLESAMEPKVSSHLRLGALQGLYYMARAGYVDSSVASTLEFMPQGHVRTDALTSASVDVLVAFKTATRATVIGVESELSQLLALARSPDVTARIVATRSVVELSQDEDTVASVITGALHDPAPEVVAQAVSAISGALLEESVWWETIVARLFALYRTSRRSVRAEIARALPKLSDKSREDPRIERLCGWASSDRSWLVREVERDGRSDQ